MKKILVLLGMIALASGVWAENTYAWTIKITNLEEGYQLPADLTAYLVDISHPLVGSETGYNTFCTLKYADVGKDVIISTSTGEDGCYAQYTKTFQTIDGNPVDDSNNSIMTVLVSPSLGKYQAVLTKFSETSGNSALGATARFNPMPIPEPTSGLLLLLGVAGLALKRKKAA